jgi:hypothetical protein
MVRPTETDSTVGSSWSRFEFHPLRKISVKCSGMLCVMVIVLEYFLEYSPILLRESVDAKFVLDRVTALSGSR